MEWDATIQAAKLRLNTRFAKAGFFKNFPGPDSASPTLKIRHSQPAKPLLHATEAKFSEKIFRRKFALKKSRTTFANPNGTPVTETDGKLSDGVTGNTLDFDSRKSRFEPWSDNRLPQRERR
jgi:hypothetical protein